VLLPATMITPEDATFVSFDISATAAARPDLVGVVGIVPVEQNVDLCHLELAVLAEDLEREQRVEGMVVVVVQPEATVAKEETAA
jgi:hypothetical protein